MLLQNKAWWDNENCFGGVYGFHWNEKKLIVLLQGLAVWKVVNILWCPSKLFPAKILKM